MEDKEQKLGMTIAVCAILISAASFYATYIQANAAEQQVKAMTYPLVQFTSGNYDTATKTQTLSLKLRNSGVGPALIKQVNFIYQGEVYETWNQYAEACCSVERKQLSNAKLGLGWGELTSVTSNIVLPINESVNILSLNRHEQEHALWDKVNRLRWTDMTLNICYCSLLENCYQTDGKGMVQEVESCPVSARSKT